MENSFIEMLLSQKHLPSPVKCVYNPDIKTIMEITCAFLNDQGGWIIVGIDENHNYPNIEAVESESKIQWELIHNISPLPLVYLQQERYQETNLLLITVIKGSLPPYTYNNKYYIFRNNSVVQPSPDEISTLMRDSFSIKSGWETIINIQSDKDHLDSKLLDQVYLKAIGNNRLSKSAHGLLPILSELELINSDNVKNGAVALFAHKANEYLPQCRIRLQLMSKGKTSDTFNDIVVFKGNIFYTLQQIMNYFKDRLPRQAFFISGKTTRINDYSYPLDVLDEAICNALIHRDYTDSFGEITIFIHPDRIEITNPGRLPDKLIKSRTEVLPHGSVLRNPLMAEIFYIAGKMEKTGRGMVLISEKMRKLGKKLPEWIRTNDSTTLILYNKTESSIPNDRIEMFLESHHKGHVFSKNDYINAIDPKPSKGTAQNDIRIMLTSGRCTKIGNGPATKYRIN